MRILAFALTMDILTDKLRASLWGVFCGDALAMPVHWYYDSSQKRADFGTITDYQAPKPQFSGSIMNLSNTGGGGRGSDKGSIIGDVICHGKKKFWLKGGNYHYHHGLRAGENTLEGSLERLLIKSMTRNGGILDADDYRNSYIKFMTTPNSHNDVYAGTCHRMFFANYVQGKDPKQCADNDGHNVDTIDGLVALVPIALSRLLEENKGKDSALKKDIKDCIWTTRASPLLCDYGEVYVEMLQEAVTGERDLKDICQRAGRRVGVDVERMVRHTQQDPMTACYLDSSFPSLLFYAAKYGEEDPEEALLRSTNAGGENVARGALLGALLGAYHGVKAFPSRFIEGLIDGPEIGNEINSFVDVAVKRVNGAKAMDDMK